MKKFIFSIAFISLSFLYPVDGGEAVIVEQSINRFETSATVTIYNDFDPNEYWADNMQWMIDHGYIAGYINSQHPITGIQGSWLNPYGNLTESQMLSILLRYELGVEDYDDLQKNVQSPLNFWSYALYVKAQELGIMTIGSPSDSSFQNQQVTRGQLAQALVSMHYGQAVTLAEAVQFMFDNGITTGINPTNGATIENFAPDTKLARVHIASFLKRYDDVKQQGNIKDVQRLVKENQSENSIALEATDLSQINNHNRKEKNIYTLKSKVAKTSDVMGDKIKTKFGERTYGSQTQIEYDVIMEIVEREYAKGFYHLEGRVQFGELQKKAVEDYFFKGKTAIKDKNNPDYQTLYNQILLGIEEIYGVFKGTVTSIEDVEMLFSLTNLLEERYRVYMNHAAYENSNYGHDPMSAYDLVVKGLLDSTSESYYNSAILDQVGIDSFVLHSPKRMHDFLVLNLYGNWYVKDDYSKDLMMYVQLTPDFLNENDQILYAPNAGIDALPKFLHDIYKPLN